jgi:hypothetical protein
MSRAGSIVAVAVLWYTPSGGGLMTAVDKEIRTIEFC